MRGCRVSRHAHHPRLPHSYGWAPPRQPCRPRLVTASSGPMVAHKRSPSRSNGKNKRPPDAGRRKPPSEIVRKGIEEDLPAVPPTADEVDWLVAWLLQHAAAFSGRRGRG